MKNKTSLLASDMDGTVIPLENGKEREEEIKEFVRLREKHPDLCLAYVTGRHLELGLDGVKKYGLPKPDIFVCDVGTTIHRKENGHWTVDEDYRDRLQRAWNGLCGDDIARLLTDITDLTAQEEEKQKEFKQSYYVPVHVARKEIVSHIHETLRRQGVDANIIYSVDTLADIGLVDVLPPIAAKDYALEYLWKSLAIEKNRVAYAGDSGNDLLAFLSGFNAILVHNTADDVKEEVREKARLKNIENYVFFASGNYVKGVMEGCYYFNIFNLS